MAVASRIRGFALAWALLALAGCAVAPPDRPQRITPTADISPHFSVPSIRERMVFLARQEWELFGRPEVDYAINPPALSYPAGVPPFNGGVAELKPPYLSRVILYWYAVSALPMVGYDGELRPWSAAFIAWLARSAGVPQKDLPSSVLHWDYIEHALAADENARFAARDARLYSPKPGDLICAPRGAEFVREVDAFERLRRGAYHCDIVVALSRDGLDAIGGNVLDSISLTHVELDGAGRVRPTPDRPWLVVLQQRDVD